MAKSNNKTDAPWLTAMAEYEGLPLALRVRPNADSPTNRAQFAKLVLVSQELAEVTSNGLPVAKYNDSLAEFDHAVHTAIEQEGAGLVVLVETFSGKRNYYAYVADDAVVKQRVRAIQEKYPQHQLEVRGGSDPEWALYNDYRQRFPW
jgi:hypothetical protein